MSGSVTTCPGREAGVFENRRMTNMNMQSETLKQARIENLKKAREKQAQMRGAAGTKVAPVNGDKITREDALRRAHAKTAEMRAAGVKLSPPKNAIEQAKAAPKSLTKALRAYFWQQEGVVENQGNEDAGAFRSAAEGLYSGARERSREIGLPATIKEICYRCEAGGIDPGVVGRVRNCGAPKCALHPVRPWRSIKGSKPVVES